MNCDTAFDLMTDPHGAASQALEQHLAACPRCRAMQETIAPALAGMEIARQGADASAEEFDPPWRHPEGALPTFAPKEAIAIAEQAAAALGTRTAVAVPNNARRTRVLRIARSAALVVFGGLVTLAVVPSLRSSAPPAQRSACRRSEAAAVPAGGRTAAEVQALIAACATCHTAPREELRENGALRRQESWQFATGAEFKLLQAFLRQAAQSTACPQNADINEGRLLCRRLQTLDADVLELDRVGVAGEPEETRLAVFSRVRRVGHQLGDLAQVAVQNRHAVQFDLYG